MSITSIQAPQHFPPEVFFQHIVPHLSKGYAFAAMQALKSVYNDRTWWIQLFKAHHPNLPMDTYYCYLFRDFRMHYRLKFKVQFSAQDNVNIICAYLPPETITMICLQLDKICQMRLNPFSYAPKGGFLPCEDRAKWQFGKPPRYVQLQQAIEEVLNSVEITK